MILFEESMKQLERNAYNILLSKSEVTFKDGLTLFIQPTAKQLTRLISKATEEVFPNDLYNEVYDAPFTDDDYQLRYFCPTKKKTKTLCVGALEAIQLVEKKLEAYGIETTLVKVKRTR